MPHVLMVNTGKAEAMDRLLEVSPDAHLDIITEKAYQPMYAPGTRLHFVDDVADLTAVRAVVLDLLALQPIDHVVAPSERSVPTGGYLRSLLGLPGIGFDTAVRFADKAVMKSALAAAGVRVAPHRVVAGLGSVEAAAEDLGWPVVLKPTLGTGSMNTFKLDGPEQLAALIGSPAADGLRKATSRLIVEAFVDMVDEFHCDGIVQDGEVRFAAVSRYFEPLLGRIDAFTGSYILPEAHLDETAIRALHDRVVGVLGLRNGVTHLEVFKTADGYVVGEIACRPAGGGIAHAVRTQFGVDIWQAFMRSALGEGPLTADHDGQRRRGGIIVNCDLPIRPGRVTRISAAADLAAIPDAIGVEMGYQAGDTIGSRLHSASTTGLVFLEVADEAAVRTRVADLASRYVLVTEAAEH